MAFWNLATWIEGTANEAFAEGLLCYTLQNEKFLEWFSFTFLGLGKAVGFQQQFAESKQRHDISLKYPRGGQKHVELKGWAPLMKRLSKLESL